MVLRAVGNLRVRLFTLPKCVYFSVCELVSVVSSEDNAWCLLSE